MSWSGPAVSEAPPQTTGGLPAAVPGHAPQDYRYATVPGGGFGSPEATVCTLLVCALRFPSQFSANDPCCISCHSPHNRLLSACTETRFGKHAQVGNKNAQARR